MGGLLAGALAGAGKASALTNGTVTLSTIGTVTPNTPYSSGQSINISVVANTTMDQASLAAAGFPSGAVNIKFLECADPGGLASNLPTKPAGCEPETIGTIAAANVDGSMTFLNYEVLALPDPNLGSSNGTVCDNDLNPCVIGIFSNQNDFSKPHIFSAPFYVTANGAADNGANPGDGSPFVSSPTSASKSTVVATPSSVTADGLEVASVTVTLKDTNGVSVTTGKQVTISQGSGHSVITVGGTATDTTTTDGAGSATFKVTDTTAEPVTYAVNDSTDGIELDATAAVTFNTPTAIPANSSITANPTSVAEANGTDSSLVTVTLDDQAVPPEPIAGKNVTLSQSAGGHSVITPISSTTNAQGQATFSVTDTTVETVTYAAVDATDSIPLTGKTASVTFGSLVVSASKSTVTASPAIVSSVASGSGLPTGTVTVTLLAADGVSPVAGKSVTLLASSHTAQVTPSPPSTATTGADGKAVFTVSDGTPELVSFSATDTTDSLAISATATVSFEVPAPSGATSGLTSNVTTDHADGISAVSLSVVIRDQFGNPVAGKAVQVIAVPGTTTRIAPLVESTHVPAGTTDPNGVAVFDAYDTAAEAVTFTATDTTDHVVVGQTVSVTFVAGLPQVSESSIAASPTSVPANGSSASTITVTIRDHNGNPVPGQSIVLTAAGGTPSVIPVSPTTNSSGKAIFNATDTNQQSVTFTATDTTESLPLVGESVTVAFGTPPPVTPVLADSAITTSRTSVPADGNSTATITVLLNDANGFGLKGKAVTLDPTSGSSVVAAVNSTTNVDGNATFVVSDKKAETVTYTATDATDGITLTGLGVTIVFGSSGASSASSLKAPVVGMAPTPDGNGYWLVASDGGIFSYGDAAFDGSTGSLTLNRPVVGMAPTPDGKGYWLVASDGGIFSYGDASFDGSTGSLTLNRPVVGMAPTPDGKGYWLVASDGGIFSYGDASFYGSTGSLTLDAPVVGMAPTPDGKGYWLVASDGGIFSYGDADFYGSTGSLTLDAPVVGMTPAPDGKGYWLVASDGGIFSYGDAPFHGSAGSLALDAPVVGMASTPDGNGYWLVAADGGIFSYGLANFYGSTAAK